MSSKIYDLEKRLFDFAVKVIKFLRTLPSTPENKVIKYQLTKSATSSGANYEEAQAGSSKPDFANKVRIALREMRESNYWLRIIEGINDKHNAELVCLIQESKELKLILGSIVQKSRT
jgi:four helix bundle protein